MLRIGDWVLRMARYGCRPSPAQIKEALKMILDKSKVKVQQFAENRPGKTWFYAFLRRHPQIKMSRVEKLEQSRAMACTKESIYAWFHEFEKFCKAKSIRSSDQIYNCDESGFPVQTATSLKVCVDKHCRRNFQIATNNKVSITTLQCICANGNVVLPAVLFPGVHFNPEYSVGFPDNFYLGFIKNDWIETSQFYAWLANHFVNYIPPLRPIVMLLDGHSSHIDFYVVEFCAANGILLFRLPPHSSHALQPADRGFFGSFKSNFSKEVTKFTVQYPGVSVTKQTFSGIFRKAYEQSCRADIVKGSFRVSGIWPINLLSVDHNLFNPGKTETPTDQSNPNFSWNDPNKEHESFDNDFEIVSENNQAALHSTPVSSVTTLIDNREQNSESSNLASNSLFEYLPKPASIVNESIRVLVVLLKNYLILNCSTKQKLTQFQGEANQSSKMSQILR